jgi:drug/metabolite transporter (DMT)-like permease
MTIFGPYGCSPAFLSFDLTKAIHRPFHLHAARLVLPAVAFDSSDFDAARNSPRKGPVAARMTPSVTRSAAPPPWLVWAALWVVYIVWGSTYLAIRVMVRTLPPLLSAGARFVLAGAVLWAILAIRKGWRHMRIDGRELAASALVGAALLFGGNGLVQLAEERGAPSSLAALLIASVPLIVILFRWLSRERISGGTLVGVAVGFTGVALLVLPGNRPAGADSLAVGLLLVASVFWAAGSFFSKSLPLPKDPFVSTATQMLTGGLVLATAGFVSGESIGGIEPTAEAIGAFVYLVVAGSLLAFTAYVWLLANAPISKVATYAYVNPVVAIFLGWLILSERITAITLVGAAIIVASVAFIVRKETQAARAARDEETNVEELVRPEVGVATESA